MSVKRATFAVVPSLPGTLPAMDTLAQLRHTKAQTCDAAQVCRKSDTRVVPSDLRRGSGDQENLATRPLQNTAGVGRCMQQEVGRLLGVFRPPSGEAARVFKQRVGDNGKTRACAYRPGSEVQGFQRAGWVRSDFQCEQVLF